VIGAVISTRNTFVIEDIADIRHRNKWYLN
jgi:hypothetical protein